MKGVGAYGHFPVVGLAKRLEEVFFPGDTDAVLVPRTSASLQLLQRIRNEAHRFAVTFQRTQRRKHTLHSALMDIPGLGDKRVRKLVKAFGSVKQVKAASTEALASVVGPALAARIRVYFEADVAAPPS